MSPASAFVCRRKPAPNQTGLRQGARERVAQIYHNAQTCERVLPMTEFITSEREKGTVSSRVRTGLAPTATLVGLRSLRQGRASVQATMGMKTSQFTIFISHNQSCRAPILLSVLIPAFYFLISYLLHLKMFYFN